MGYVIEGERPKDGVNRSEHGYDEAAPEMRALFLATGPAIVPGKHLPDFDNVDVAILLRDLLGV